MKTVRIREKIKLFLSDRPRNTAEILEHINTTMRHGTTSQQLGNVLSKDKDIVKVGYIKRSGILSGGYDICEWATVIWVQEHVDDWAPGDPIHLDKMGNNLLLKKPNTNNTPRLNPPLKAPPAPKQPARDLNNLNCNQLKDLLREANLKVGGRKQELIDRLEMHSLPRVEHDPMHG
jgi:hypothetical protein